MARSLTPVTSARNSLWQSATWWTTCGSTRTKGNGRSSALNAKRWLSKVWMVSFILYPYNLPPTSKQPIGAVQFPQPIRSSHSFWPLQSNVTLFIQHFWFLMFCNFSRRRTCAKLCWSNTCDHTGGWNRLSATNVASSSLLRATGNVTCQSIRAPGKRLVYKCAYYASRIKVVLHWLLRSSLDMNDIFFVPGITNVSTATRSSPGVTIWLTIWR